MDTEPGTPFHHAIFIGGFEFVIENITEYGILCYKCREAECEARIEIKNQKVVSRHKIIHKHIIKAEPNLPKYLTHPSLKLWGTPLSYLGHPLHYLSEPASQSFPTNTTTIAGVIIPTSSSLPIKVEERSKSPLEEASPRKILRLSPSALKFSEPHTSKQRFEEATGAELLDREFQHRSELHAFLYQNNILTDNNESFVLLNNEQFGNVIFTCDTNLKFLIKFDKIYLTYFSKNSAPDHFKEKMIVHVLHNNSYVPLIFIILTKKSIISYMNIFQAIKSRCLQLNNDYKLKVVHTDYDREVHRAIEEVWRAEIDCCDHHFRELWLRQLKVCRLIRSVKNLTPSGILMRYIFGLQYLDKNQVYNCFISEIEGKRRLLHDGDVDSFLDYVYKHFIDEDQAPFPIHRWAGKEFNNNNICEMYSLMYKGEEQHQTLRIFINDMRNIQARVQTIINSPSEDYKPLKIDPRRNAFDNEQARLYKQQFIEKKKCRYSYIADMSVLSFNKLFKRK